MFGEKKKISLYISFSYSRESEWLLKSDSKHSEASSSTWTATISQVQNNFYMILIKQNDAAIFEESFFLSSSSFLRAEGHRQNVPRSWCFGVVCSSALPHRHGLTAITGQCDLKTVQCRVKKRGCSWCPVKIFHMQMTLDSLGVMPVRVVFTFVVMAKWVLQWFLFRFQSTTELKCD